MALTEFQQKLIGSTVSAYIAKHGPPEEIWAEVKMDYRISGQSVEIFELRPLLMDKSKVLEHPIAKATLVKTTGKWKVFWHRADMKWHSYPPDTEVESIDAFLEVIEKDEHACFFG